MAEAAEYAPRILRLLLLCLLLVVVPAGCGGGKSPPTPTIATRTASPTAAAVCLNSDAFLVEEQRGTIQGSSPGGINFTVRFYPSVAAANAAAARLDPMFAAVIAATVVDFAGNPPAHPAGAPMRLIRNDLATLRVCIELRHPG